MRQPVLLLNATYEVLSVVSISRAVALVIAEKADIIEEADEPLRSATAEMPRPSVIRLRYYVKVPFHARVPLNRRNLTTRDNGRCGYCGGRGSTIDHIKPRALGGPHRWENVTLSCGPCNQAKGHKTLEELGWKLLNEPSVPERRTHMIVGLARVEDSWAEWLEPSLAVT